MSTHSVLAVLTLCNSFKSLQNTHEHESILLQLVHKLKVVIIRVIHSRYISQLLYKCRYSCHSDCDLLKEVLDVLHLKVFTVFDETETYFIKFRHFVHEFCVRAEDRWDVFKVSWREVSVGDVGEDVEVFILFIVWSECYETTFTLTEFILL